jgi:hypothetical protein
VPAAGEKGELLGASGEAHDSGSQWLAAWLVGGGGAAAAAAFAVLQPHEMQDAWRWWQALLVASTDAWKH